MNRHERRRLGVSAVPGISGEKYRSMRRMCGWEGCLEVTEKPPPIPDGWVWLLTYSDPQFVVDFRKIKQPRHDKVLCPTHAKALDDLLKQLSVAAAPSVGSE